MKIRDSYRARCFLAALLCTLGTKNISFALSEPRLRISDYFGAPAGVNYLNPSDVGQHGYHTSSGEKVGMIYTQRAGFLDIGHVREAADRTRYAADVVYYHLIRSNRRFKFSMIEPSDYYVKVYYPASWRYLDNAAKKKLTRQVAICYGQYLAHQSLIWHELVTWFGYASSGLFSEHISSFSWDDTYSDVLGTWLGAEAVRRGGSYDEQVTQLLAGKLKELKAERANIGRKAEKIIKDKWYTGGAYFFVDMKKRNFDVGFDDGQVSPWPVPGLYPYAKPLSWPAPDASCLDDYDFEIELRIDPKVSEKSKIYSVLGLDMKHDRIEPATDFPKLLKYIKQKAHSKYGEDVDKPTL